MSAQSTSDVLSPQRKVAEGIPYNDDPSAINEPQSKVRAIFQQGKAKATEMEKGFEHYVQAKPVQSVLIAAGAGLLVGYLFGRRR
jgi:ElaB/YqjD/DUF883 family membrane-anchored ribosome-binding protein